MTEKWYRLRLVASGVKRVDKKATSKQDVYVAEWRTGGMRNPWHTYAGSRGTWGQAYEFLERRTTPAALEVWFVGTF